jgi:hypothetical protein
MKDFNCQFIFFPPLKGFEFSQRIVFSGSFDARLLV